MAYEIIRFFKLGRISSPKQQTNRVLVTASLPCSMLKWIQKVRTSGFTDIQRGGNFCKALA